MEIPCGWMCLGEEGGCGAHPTRWVGDGHKGEDEMVPGSVWWFRCGCGLGIE